MSILESIIKNQKPNERASIPAGAMAHLEKMGDDRCFVGSVVFANHVVPTIWIKFSLESAHTVGMKSDELYQPGFKFDMIEDQNHDLVIVVTMVLEDLPALHFPLNPGHRAVQDFLELLRSTECFALDISVETPDETFGVTTFLETDGNSLEWVGRNLVRSRTVVEWNDWASAFESFLNAGKSEEGAVNIAFDQPEAQVVDARRSSEFITRGDDAFKPDLSVLRSNEPNYRYEWLREEHGLHVASDWTLLIKDQALIAANNAIYTQEIKPQQLVEEFEKLRRRFPGESFLFHRLLAWYRYLGDEKGAQSVLQELAAESNPDLLTKLLQLSSLSPKEQREAWRRNWHHPEAHYYIEGERAVTLDEFLLFEEYAILELADAGKLPLAIRRFDRLVEFGSYEETCRSIANTIVREVLKMEVKVAGQLPRTARKKQWPGVGSAASDYLNEAYLDHASYLINEFEQRRAVVPPPPSLRMISAPKIGRNAPCPCGSGKKYKHCCGK